MVTCEKLNNFVVQVHESKSSGLPTKDMYLFLLMLYKFVALIGFVVTYDILDFYISSSFLAFQKLRQESGDYIPIYHFDIQDIQLHYACH